MLDLDLASLIINTIIFKRIKLIILITINECWCVIFNLMRQCQGKLLIRKHMYWKDKKKDQWLYLKISLRFEKHGTPSICSEKKTSGYELEEEDN